MLELRDFVRHRDQTLISVTYPTTVLFNLVTMILIVGSELTDFMEIIRINL